MMFEVRFAFRGGRSAPSFAYPIRCDGFLQVFRFQSSMLGNSCEHFWADLIAMMKSPDIMRSARFGKQEM